MSSRPIVYMIRHGEKPADDKIRGLSQAGSWRAQCLPGVFGGPDYSIGKIFAQKYNTEDGAEERPYDTVKPLADFLKLDVDVDFKRGKSQKVADAVNAFSGPGNILICWEHKALSDIAGALGVDPPPEYDSSHFDYLWTLNDDHTAITQTTYTIPPDPELNASGNTGGS